MSAGLGDLSVYVATWRTRPAGDDPEDIGIMLHPDRETARRYEADGAGRAERLPRPLWDFAACLPEVDCPACGDGLRPVAVSTAPKLACPSCDFAAAAVRGPGQ